MPVALYTDDPNQPQLSVSIDWTVNVPNDGKDASN